MKLTPASNRIAALVALILPLWLANSSVAADDAKPDQQWVVFQGKDGPGHGKHIVFVIGDDEYKSEEGMPLLARILAERHGFKCTCLFAINKTTGVIDVSTKDNIPGLEALDHADLMVLFTRFRELPDEQIKHIIDYCESGRPVIGLRTATHAFNYKKESTSPYKKYTWTSKEPGFDGGWGRLVLGETWIAHHGHHGHQSTRGLIAKGMEDHPILRGIKDGEIWGSTDVYAVTLPLPGDSKPLVMGQVLTAMDPKDSPAPPAEDAKTKKVVDKNNPMMPVAWTRTYTGSAGKAARVFTTTMGGAMPTGRDLDNEPLRRLLVNACYWAVGLEEKIPAKANVDVVGENPFKRGVKPQDCQPR